MRISANLAVRSLSYTTVPRMSSIRILKQRCHLGNYVWRNAQVRDQSVMELHTYLLLLFFYYFDDVAPRFSGAHYIIISLQAYRLAVASNFCHFKFWNKDLIKCAKNIQPCMWSKAQSRLRHRMKKFLEYNLAIWILEINIKAFDSKFLKMQ